MYRIYTTKKPVISLRSQINLTFFASLLTKAYPENSSRDRVAEMETST